jgi:hypothetical protein
VNNKTITQARDGQVIVGVKTDLQSVPSLPLAGDTYTPTSLIAFIQSRIDQANKVLAARAQYLAEVQAYRALDTKANAVVRGLRSYVVNAFGETSPKLADFGFTPSRRATRTTEEKAASARKGAATRKARGTMSKKAKSKITGETAPSTPPAIPHE